MEDEAASAALADLHDWERRPALEELHLVATPFREIRMCPVDQRIGERGFTSEGSSTKRGGPPKRTQIWLSGQGLAREGLTQDQWPRNSSDGRQRRSGSMR